MRILVVTDNRFWRGQFGSQRRIWSLCDHFTQQGHEICIIFKGFIYLEETGQFAKAATHWNIHTLGNYSEPVQAVSTIAQVAMCKKIRRYVKQLYFEFRRRFQRKPPNCPHLERDFHLQLQEPKLKDFEDPQLLTRFTHLCVNFQPEVILVEFVRLSFLLKAGIAAIPDGCIAMVDTHDIQYERQTRFHQRGEVHDIDISPAEEAKALSRADIVIAIQATDASKLRALLPGKKIVVAGFPNVIFRHPVSVGKLIKIGFIGSSMPPNLQAATLLIKMHFPQLRNKYGTAVELHIFGNISGSLGVPAAESGIFFHGFVEDLTAVYGCLDIIANPVQFGGGLKIKNVEALCHGRPLITTTIGAEGIEDGIGLAFIVADSIDFFSEALEELIKDPARRVRLAQAALVYAEAHFSEARTYQELDDVLASEFERIN